MLGLVMALVGLAGGGNAASGEPAPPAVPGIAGIAEADKSRPASFSEYVGERTKEPRITLSSDGQTLYVVGSFDQGTYFRASEIVRSAPGLKTVYLASYGGLTTEGRLLALLIRQHRLNTYVEHVCASACTMAFVAGQTRTLGDKGKIGFHQSYVVDDRGTTGFDDKVDAPYLAGRGFPAVVGVSGTLIMRRTFEDAGLNPVFIERALATPSWSMWYPDTNAMRTAFVFTRRAASPELAPPPQVGRTREEIDDDLAGQPLWRTFRAHSPDDYDEAAEDVWRDANTGSSLAIARWHGRDRLLGYIEEDLKSAPEVILDQILGIRGELAQWQRARGYAECRTDEDFVTRAPSPDELAFAAREDAVVIRFMESASRAASVPGDDAEDEFGRFADQIAASGRFDVWTRTGPDYGCKSSYQLIEAIAGLPPKKRTKAYRALLSIPPEEPWMRSEKPRERRAENANDRPPRPPAESASEN